MLMTWVSIVIESIFELSLFVNALLFVPQAFKLFQKKDSSELSLITFIGFNIVQLFAVLNGIIHNDYISIVGWTLSFTTCGSITFLILFYRKKIRNNHIKNT